MSSCMPLWLWYLLLLAVVIMRGCGEMMCEPDAYGQPPSSESARPRLRRDLLCEYDPEVQPERNMNITYELFVRRARVEHRTLEMKVLINLRWRDPFLVWDPARYDDVSRMQINSAEIWTPDVATISTLPWIREEAGAYQSDVWPSTCSVASDGIISCVGAMDVGGACSVSYLYWPHVEATCGTLIGSDFRTAKHVSLQFYNDSLQTELQNYVPDNDWVVTDASREYVFYFGNEGRDGGALAYTFTLHSRGAVIQAGLIGPAIILSLLLLASFALPTLSTTRLGLCCCSAFGTVLLSSRLFESLPPYDGPSPVVVTFYSALLALSAIAIVMTLLLNILTPRVGKPPGVPRWLYTIQSWLLNSTGGKLCLRVLLLAPKCQTEEFADQAEDGEHRHGDGSTSPQERLQARSSRKHDNGPHRIWEFTVSFVDRSLLFIFLIACGTLSLCLLHAVATYQDVDNDIFE